MLLDNLASRGVSKDCIEAGPIRHVWLNSSYAVGGWGVKRIGSPVRSEVVDEFIDSGVVGDRRIVWVDIYVRTAKVRKVGELSGSYMAGSEEALIDLAYGFRSGGACMSIS